MADPVTDAAAGIQLDVLLDTLPSLDPDEAGRLEVQLITETANGAQDGDVEADQSPEPYEP